MNSPASALIWELGRKHRWGFALLVALLGTCVALAQWVAWQQQRVANCEASLPMTVEGSLAFLTRGGNYVLSSSEHAIVPSRRSDRRQLSLGTLTLYDGPAGEQDELAWSGLPNRPDWIRFTLNGTNLHVYRGPLPPPPIRWTDAQGQTRSQALLMRRAHSDELLDLTSTAESWRQISLGWSIALLVVSFLVVCAIFGGAEPHPARGFSGLPPRRFTLPVRTGMLVGWPLALGLLTLWLLYGGWSVLVFRRLLPTEAPMPGLLLALVWGVGLVWFQALVWGLPSFPRLRGWLIGGLVLGLIGSAFALLVQEPDRGPPELVGTYGSYLILAALGGGIGAAWYGVRQERRGRWAGGGGASWLPAVLRTPAVQQKSFGSALQAQCWLEWRRNARVPFFICMGATVALVGLVCGFRSDFSRPPYAADALFGLYGALMVVWFGLTGLNLSRDAGSHRLALSAWSASRPVTTGALLWPKLLTGGALWLGAVLVILLGSAAVRGLTGRLQWPPAAIPLFLAASSLNLLVGILPLCLSGRIPGFPWSLAPLVLLYGLAATAWGWVGDHPQFHAAVFVLLVALVALKLMVTYGAFHRSLVLELVSPRFVAGCVGGWLVAAGGLTLAVVLLMLDAGKWDLSSLLALPIAVLIVPLARIALSPLALALNRHR